MMDNFDWRSIIGWFSEEDVKFILNIIQQIHNMTIVEIGCFYGRSTASWIKKALNNNNQVYVIDNFYGPIDENAPASKVQRSQGDQVMKQFIENMKKLGIDRSSYMLWKNNSMDALIYAPNNACGMIFIDADHSYESVKKDIENWWIKIKKGFWLAGHDFQNPEVRKAIEEFAILKSVEIRTGGNCWAIIKNLD